MFLLLFRTLLYTQIYALFVPIFNTYTITPLQLYPKVGAVLIAAIQKK